MVLSIPIAGPSTQPPHNGQHRLITSSMVKRRRRPQKSSNFHLPIAPPLLKINQWQHWTNEVITSLIAPYLAYLRKSTSLRDRIELQPDEAAAFQCRSSCRRRALEITCILFNRIYFACVPIAPSLTVDLQLLEFVKTLFVHITPNMTAWCETLEVFLAGRGYQLTTKDNLRCRFGNTYHWYSVLCMSAEDHLSNLIGNYRPLPVSSNEGLTCPSNYLRSHCPICFGSVDWQKSGTLNLSRPDVHACIDACFTQKCSSDQHGGGPDPPNPIRSVFLSDDKVILMDTHVQSCRGRPPAWGHKRKRPTEEEEDGYKNGMRVLTSALDGCGESFFAADEKREKASTQFFADTGVMAMLCRHDRVLWLANITSAGEKQHYALALIKKLFDNIPPEMTISLFCLKYPLLDDAVLRRITFAISVFHAYGHQWACQIIYHPRKCEGFGLSDGEGCERLWSALKHLIAPGECSLVQEWFHMGYSHSWLIRSWNNCAKKKSNAMQALHELSVDETPVCQQCKLQVEHQMRPLPRRSKTSNDEEISKILSVKKSLVELDRSLRRIEMQLCTGNVDNLTRLGISQRTREDQLRRNVYLQIHLDAQALKTRLRERLQQRKFEIEKLECSYRQTVNEHKLNSHVDTAIQRHNLLCADLSALIRQCRSPPNAIAPNPISPAGIFNLDDIGLDDVVPEPPDWLADEVTCAAIRLVLEIDQCNKEELHVKVECCALQEWAIVEWDALQRARAHASDDDIIMYHMDLRARQFIDLVLGWQTKIRPIPCAWPMPDCWGPSHNELANVTHVVCPDVHDDEDDVGEDRDDWESDIGFGDNELMDVLEDIALTDQYRGEEVDYIEDGYVVNDSLINSPTKCVVFML
ncbi:uncharacterized protein F5891DRAFT_1130428 [Suillus fuscotomentosus]|uniref:CxC1-like cysteine cluster associated with KDZ transposases domain-containing protein n=1 Tax=Suillus fuscotomentosus TaxID=1912939 RepID=A0AAD4HGQ6_9AGAM|nr:uncharacterized protein F5891DRAFT_1130428 [Suillus fuscotomentosus]KAG1895948.1 hypothetical protein F5891DRAFT_1130428 [Suillus fuscotomentosus]